MSKSQIKDLTGKKFQMLTALEFAGYHISGKAKVKRRAYLWQCDCGSAPKIICAENVVRSKSPTRSCGCLIKDNFTGSLAVAYSVFKDCGYSDGNISFEQFLKLAEQPCHYCGNAPSRIRKSRCGKYEWCGNGLDRKSNIGPHMLEDVVVSCFPCNDAKSNRTYEEFCSWIKIVHNKFIEREI